MKKEDVVNLKGFYQLPKFLFKEEQYQSLSTKAKTVYALFVDRLKISIKNEWLDKDNNVYIIFTNEDVAKELNCCIEIAIKVVKELKSYKFITTKRQVLGKPNLIYIENFEYIQPKKSCDKKQDFKDIEFLKHEELLKENISYEYFIKNLDIRKQEMVNEILDLMLEVVCTTNSDIKLAKDKIVSTDLFKAKIFKINYLHIEYLFDSFEKITCKVTNIKSYLLSCLFNIPSTINDYYSNWLKSDFANGYN